LDSAAQQSLRQVRPRPLLVTLPSCSKSSWADKAWVCSSKFLLNFSMLPNFSTDENRLEDSLNKTRCLGATPSVSGLLGLRWSPIICISRKFPGGASRKYTQDHCLCTSPWTR
jgi:hypothetical protein